MLADIIKKASSANKIKDVKDILREVVIDDD